MTRRRRTTDDNGALTTLMLQILLVLTEGPRHGYAILQEIETRTDAAFEIGAATLYRTIKRLVDAAMIEEVPSAAAEHSQRRAYRITAAGTERAAAEAERLETIVAWARDVESLRLGAR
jgi:DNA-binding PadR family transcriptional regulator